MLEFLSHCVRARLNTLISGGTGAGKTTLLNVLSSFIGERERIVTIEDAAELQLHQEHVVRLETRPPNVEGKGAVRQRQLLVNALRMRPDRIIVGEVRSEEALDMLQAMNTGHDGSLTTVHANTPRDALSRIETMIAMGATNLPERAISAFYRIARPVVATRPQWRAIILARPDGQVLMHTGYPPGRSDLAIAEPESFDQLVQTQGAAGRTDAAWTARRVRRAGARAGAARRHAALRADRRPQPRGDSSRWSATSACPRTGWCRCSTPSGRASRARARNAKYIGTPPAPSLQRLMAAGADEGVGVTYALEGDAVLTAFTRIKTPAGRSRSASR